MRHPRKFEWILFALAIVGGAVLLSLKGQPLHEGEHLRETLTLITSDRYDLSCFHPEALGEYRCLYSKPGHPFRPHPDYDKMLVPYVTIHGQLLFVPGLFSEPALVERLKNEPPQHHSRDSLRRFNAHCDLVLVQKVRLPTRFGTFGGYSEPKPGWIATASNCTVTR